MFRNSLHPIQIFSVFLLGFVVLSLSIGIQLLKDLLRRHLGPSSITDINWADSSAIVSLICLVVGFFFSWRCWSTPASKLESLVSAAWRMAANSLLAGLFRHVILL